SSGIFLSQTKRVALRATLRQSKIKLPNESTLYSVDSISKPQASSKGSGMYFEFLLRRAHSRSRVERKYWSGVNLYSRTTCSNSVIVGVIGPIGSGLPQLGLPRLFAMKNAFLTGGNKKLLLYVYDSPSSTQDAD